MINIQANVTGVTSMRIDRIRIFSMVLWSVVLTKTISIVIKEMTTLQMKLLLTTMLDSNPSWQLSSANLWVQRSGSEFHDLLLIVVKLFVIIPLKGISFLPCLLAFQEVVGSTGFSNQIRN